MIFFFDLRPEWQPRASGVMQCGAHTIMMNSIALGIEWTKTTRVLYSRWGQLVTGVYVAQRMLLALPHALRNSPNVIYVNVNQY